MTKRILIAALMALSAIAQQTVTLTALAPQGVTGLGSGIGGSGAAPGNITACYWVVTNYVGGSILSARPTCPTNVPASLSSTNYVLLTWQPITAPQLTFDVLKTATAVPPLAGVVAATHDPRAKGLGDGPGPVGRKIVGDNNLITVF